MPSTHWTGPKGKHVEMHNNEWPSSPIMRNYTFKSRDAHPHPSQGWRSAVCDLFATKPDWMSARMSDYERWQLIMSVFTETRCFLLNKALFWSLCVFSNAALTVPGEHKCARAYSLHQWDEGKPRGEILCRERRSTKRSDIEEGWCREEKRGKGRGSHGERSCQSLGDFKHTTALWSACSLALGWQLPDCAA